MTKRAPAKKAPTKKAVDKPTAPAAPPRTSDVIELQRALQACLTVIGALNCRSSATFIIDGQPRTPSDIYVAGLTVLRRT